MRLDQFMDLGGEHWEIRRNVISGKVCKQTYKVVRTDANILRGSVFAVEAYYGDSSKGSVGHTVNIGTAVGSQLMFDSPGGSQKVNVTFTTESAADLKVIIKGLIGELDELGLSDSDKEVVKEDAEYLKRKLDGGKAEPGLIRECLTSIKKKLVDAAAAAASSKIVTKAGHYLGLISDFITNTFGG